MSSNHARRLTDTSPGPPRHRRPRPDAVTALCCFIVLLLAIPSSLGLGALGSAGAPATVVGVVAFLWWCWHHLHRPRFHPVGVQPVRWAIVIMLFCAILSYAHAMSRPLPGDEVSPADSALIRLVSICGIALVANDGIRSEKRMRLLVNFVIVAAASVAALSILQVITGQLWVDRISIPGLVRNASIDLTARQGLVRPSGTANHPLEFAAVLSMVLPIAIMSARSKDRIRWQHLAIISLIFLGILLSLSRTAILCVALGLAIIFPALPRLWRIVGIGAGVAMLGILSAVMPGLFGTLRGLFLGISDDPSIQSRTDSYALVAEIWSNNPWIGRGLGTFLPKYWILDNMYLQALVELGLLGLLALAGVSVTAFVCGWRVQTRYPPGPDRDLVRGITAGVAAGAASFAFFDALSFPQSAFTLFLLIGMAGAYWRLARRTAAEELDPPSRTAAGGSVATAEGSGPSA